MSRDQHIAAVSQAMRGWTRDLRKLLLSDDEVERDRARSIAATIIVDKIAG